MPDGAHLRIHPLLHWTEIDIWRYTQRENIPYCSLYLAKDGMRYRSLGEKNITLPVPSDAATLDAIIAELAATSAPERAGRTMDHESEDAFERLRQGGYMLKTFPVVFTGHVDHGKSTLVARLLLDTGYFPDGNWPSSKLPPLDAAYRWRSHFYSTRFKSNAIKPSPSTPQHLVQQRHAAICDHRRAGPP